MKRILWMSALAALTAATVAAAGPGLFAGRPQPPATASSAVVGPATGETAAPTAPTPTQTRASTPAAQPTAPQAPACGVPCCPPACCVAPAPAKENYVENLLTIIDTTKSKDSFLVTLELLTAEEVASTQAVPRIIKNAERLGILGDSSKPDCDSTSVSRIAVALHQIRSREMKRDLPGVVFTPAMPQAIPAMPPMPVMQPIYRAPAMPAPVPLPPCAYPQAPTACPPQMPAPCVPQCPWSAPATRPVSDLPCPAPSAIGPPAPVAEPLPPPVLPQPSCTRGAMCRPDGSCPTVCEIVVDFFRGLFGAATYESGMTLPSGTYLQTPPQYFPPPADLPPASYPGSNSSSR